MDPPLLSAVNQALEVCCELEDHLLIDLHEILSEPRACCSDAALPVLLCALQENLERQLGLKAHFASDAKSKDSNLFQEIEALKSEGNDCNTELARIRVQVVTEFAVAALSATSREELAGWARSLVAYRRHEKRVLPSEYDREDGGKGR